MDLFQEQTKLYPQLITLVIKFWITSSNEESNPTHGCREGSWMDNRSKEHSRVEWRFLFSEAAASCVWRVVT